MAKKTVMRDLVVLLPGIMGSVFQKDNKDLFALSWGAGLRALISGGGSLQNMLLQDDDSDGKDLADGITTPRLISDARVIPGFFKIDGYTGISNFIKSNFDVVQGSLDLPAKPANYFEFPYDWRRYNRVAALNLKNLIDRHLPQWKEYSGNDDAKTILIGHSMGGLVARYYLEKLEGWKTCRALITFGTPHRGAVNALDFLVNGYKKRFIDLSAVLRSFNSAYELLPIYKVIEVNGDYQRVEDTPGLPHIDLERARSARLNFHEEIRLAVEAHKQDPQYSQRYKIVPIVGTRQPTLQSATFAGGDLTASEVVPSTNPDDQILAEGDGTVPRLSATPIELSTEYRETFFSERHASLQNNDSVLTDLANRLKQTQVNLDQFRGAVPSPQKEAEPAIGLRLDDMYYANEPIVMTARLINVSDRLRETPPTARITSTTSEVPVPELKFSSADDEWQLIADPLSPGLYRVEVLTSEFAAGAPPPVHDIFEVQNV